MREYYDTPRDFDAEEEYKIQQEADPEIPTIEKDWELEELWEELRWIRSGDEEEWMRKVLRHGVKQGEQDGGVN